MKKNTQKGFTLVELLVVIAILAILASVAVVGYTSFIEKADKQAAATEMDQVVGIIDNAFLVETAVKVVLPGADATKTDDDITLELTKDDDGNIVAAKKASTATDITSDIGNELIAKLTWDDTNGLSYSYKEGKTGDDYVKVLATVK